MGDPRRYADLSRQELEQRLARAEDAVVMWAWSPADPHTTNEREMATFELWRRWEEAGGSSDRAANPHLTDERIHELAQARERRRLGLPPIAGDR